LVVNVAALRTSVAAWLLGGVAWAEEPPPVLDLTSEPAPQVVPRGPQPDAAIRRGGPDAERDLAAVAVDVDDPAVRMVVTVDGAVWRSRDAGISWELVLVGQDVLGGASSQEDALLDLETRMTELVEELASGDPDEEIDPTGELQAEVRAGTAWLERVQQAGGDEARVLPRAWSLGDAVWAVGRPDGLWLSRDRGDTWRRRLMAPVTALASHGPVTVAGGPEGAWWSTEGETWEPAPGLMGVLDLASTASGFVAVTEVETLVSADGVSWSRVSADGGRAVAVDPAGGWYRASETAVVTSSDSGATWRSPTGVVGVSGILEVLVLPNGVVLAAGSGGVAQSEDGGGRWTPLLSADGGVARGLAWDGSAMLVASDEGLFELTPTAPEAKDGRLEPWMPLGDLLVAAERRSGMNPSSGQLGPGGQALLWLLPQVRGAFGVNWVDGLGSRLDAGLEGGAALYIGGGVQITWSPPRRDLSAADNVIDVEDDGTVNVYGEGADNWMALGRSGRRASLHRLEVAEEIVALYERHEEVRRQAGDARPRPLADSVQLALRIEEIEARLDLLTDGAVRIWEQSQGGGGG
jgi:hypothetical protein